MKKIIWIWTPKKSVGDFKFGSVIFQYMNKLTLTKFNIDYGSTEENVIDSAYHIKGYESGIYCENDIITSLLCCDSLIYNGTELLGAEFNVISQMLPEQFYIEPVADIGSSAYYSMLGITLWLNNENIISRASCDA